MAPAGWPKTCTRSGSTDQDLGKRREGIAEDSRVVWPAEIAAVPFSIRSNRRSDASTRPLVRVFF
jgi:hypothetical protein